ncbi:magnesium transporter [Anabaena subtropica]|uniref:Magnesium transporter MgtE n=1 Tax=Anabaena subtropica FACHB-260 TaxID=2692884 RepID=A0ABR8CUK3_9NOST|nr:magnesium transporter [Anabaena subtropica]MBD2346038.1 magnesium transporter [Anabaena subtropica FACHB-260]
MNQETPPTYQPTSSRQELQELVQAQLERLLSQENYEGAKALLIPVQYVDIAEVIGNLPEPMQAIAFRLLSKEEAIEVFEYLDSNVQQALISDFKRQDVQEILDRMSPDDRARLFDELPAKVVRRLLQQLTPAERDSTALLLGYKPNTAGRIMTPEYLSIKENMTITQTLERIRSLADASELIYYIYVTDDARRLTGTFSLRNLITAQPEDIIGNIMTRDVVYVHTDTDQEEVARTIQRYDFLAVPVVDNEKRLVGIVTVDDVLDILQQETTEDIYKLGGLESAADNYFQTNLFTVARRRVSWLLILLLTNTLTSTVISGQEDILEQVVSLAAFIPLLIDTGGNVGAQSSTVVIRGLNTQEVRSNQAGKIIRKETTAGIVLGAMLGVVVTVWATFLQGNVGVSLAVGISLFAISIMASFAGAALPFLFRAMKLDPALMSAPFITTAVDVFGVLVYFNVARLILRI